MIKIGVIGGSGVYKLENLKVIEEKEISTPFGNPSDKIVIGELKNIKIAFLPRHGVGHRLLPSEVNYRANIYAMKLLGVEYLISISSVGSMKGEIHPEDIVLPDQFIDLTRKRESTFFGEGIVAHIQFSQPTCPRLRKIIYDSAKNAGYRVHDGGVYVNIEGPQFSTYGESLAYRSWGVDVIGMTNATEAKLAREAEMCYATINLVTDYDCWKSDEEEVSVELVIQRFNSNIKKAKKILEDIIDKIITDRSNCLCANALENAIITAREKIPEETLEKLKPIIGKYI